MLRSSVAATLAAFLLVPALASSQTARKAPTAARSIEISLVPALEPLAESRRSELADVVSRYDTDRSALGRRYGVEYSPARTKRMEEFTSQWLARLREVDFEKLSQEGRVDYVLLRHELEYDQYQLKRGREQLVEMQAYTPFAATIFDVMETRRELKPVNQQEAGRTLSALAKQVDSVRRAVEKLTSSRIDTTNPRVRDSLRTARFVGFRTAGFVENLRTTLGQWYRYYSGYDPLFSWWAEDPYKKTDDALRTDVEKVRALREKMNALGGGPDPLRASHER